MATCSLAKYAERHGASKQAATKWKSRGVLVFSGDLVDVAKSDRRMRDAGLGNFKQGSTIPSRLTPRSTRVRLNATRVNRARAATRTIDDVDDALMLTASSLATS
jgi:hypothetical protein